MLEQGPNPREELMESIANSVVYIEKDGTQRLPYYDAIDTVNDIVAQGKPGGCAEGSGAFLFGRERLIESGLMPDFSQKQTEEAARIIMMKERLEGNYFELSRGQASYHPPLKFSQRNIDVHIDELRNPQIKKFLLCTTGNFPDPSSPTGVVLSGHMIAGIRGDLSNLPIELSGMKPLPGTNDPPYWIYDANNFGIYQPRTHTTENIFPSAIPYPQGLRLVRAQSIKNLVRKYSLPECGLSLKFFYE